MDSVDLDAPEWSGDINNVTSVLKLWLRELPEPLLTFNLYHGYIEAASEWLMPSESARIQLTFFSP